MDLFNQKGAQEKQDDQGLSKDDISLHKYLSQKDGIESYDLSFFKQIESEAYTSNVTSKQSSWSENIAIIPLMSIVILLLGYSIAQVAPMIPAVSIETMGLVVISGILLVGILAFQKIEERMILQL